MAVSVSQNSGVMGCLHGAYRGVNYSEKSVRRFLGLENPGNFSRDSGIFLPKFKGFWDFFQLIFSKYFPLFFFAELFPKFFATYNPSNNF